MKWVQTWLLGVLLGASLASAAWGAGTADRTVRALSFPKGASGTEVRGSVQGYHFMDYQLKASAGQRIRVALKGSLNANAFNLLSPGAQDVAMAMGEFSGNRVEAVLPDDGVYTVRVFLIRSAARRNERSDFTLSVDITGTPLKPLSAQEDARLPGTRYHAKGSVACAPAYSEVRECEALVVRRGRDGTATVELRWAPQGQRLVLFVKGQPVSADTPQPMRFERNERGWSLQFEGGERFEVPEPLVMGG